jgi:hypothetical protein
MQLSPSLDRTKILPPSTPDNSKCTNITTTTTNSQTPLEEQPLSPYTLFDHQQLDISPSDEKFIQRLRAKAKIRNSTTTLMTTTNTTKTNTTPAIKNRPYTCPPDTKTHPLRLSPLLDDDDHTNICPQDTITTSRPLAKAKNKNKTKIKNKTYSKPKTDTLPTYKTSSYPYTSTTHRFQTIHRDPPLPNLFEDYPDINPREATAVLRLRARAKMKYKNRTKRKTNPSKKTNKRPRLKKFSTFPTTCNPAPPALKTQTLAEAEAERINLFQEVIRIFKPG